MPDTNMKYSDSACAAERLLRDNNANKIKKNKNMCVCKWQDDQEKTWQFSVAQKKSEKLKTQISL